ncbi:hypothetical protein [Phytohabitans rumicis]|uniref:Uncharacterized protein n=1 Tax=Phytohabitans rumicis TaxID=1076125 RepID=A0A6V8LGI6_9ACTN|nr:hypothetical protein [Phytohabitans rumicis]GFJ93971.1 hypothetical protein Prum_076130 [Phytohabitans rumicis]
MTMRGLLADRLRIIRLLRYGGAGPVTALVAINLVLGLLPVAFVLATARLLGLVPAAVEDGLSSAAFDSLVTAFIVAAATFAGQQILAPLASAVGVLVARRVDGHVFDLLMAATLGTRASRCWRTRTRWTTCARRSAVLRSPTSRPARHVPGRSR